MMQLLRLLGRGGRVLSLVLLAALGSTVLMRYAPGYFADSRELDAAHGEEVRTQLQQLQATQRSLPALLRMQCASWRHGDLGLSRHYDVPVSGLLRERCGATLRLLGYGMGAGWLLAGLLALPLSLRRGAGSGLLVKLAVATLMAIPVGALATFSLLLNTGGPVLTLALLVAVRDFKLLYSLFVAGWQAPHLFHARAQGFSGLQSFRVHLLQMLRPELVNLAAMSAVVALSALVPVEVVFDVPGLGQLAWVAALNRDLPVLVAMTALMAVCVAGVGLLSASKHTGGTALCE